MTRYDEDDEAIDAAYEAAMDRTRERGGLGPTREFVAAQYREGRPIPARLDREAADEKVQQEDES